MKDKALVKCLSFLQLGHPYCSIFKFGECVICEGPKEKLRYSKNLREYLNHASSVDLIADCKIPRRKTEGKAIFIVNVLRASICHSLRRYV